MTDQPDTRTHRNFGCSYQFWVAGQHAGKAVVSAEYETVDGRLPLNTRRELNETRLVGLLTQVLKPGCRVRVDVIGMIEKIRCESHLCPLVEGEVRIPDQGERRSGIKVNGIPA